MVMKKLRVTVFMNGKFVHQSVDDYPVTTPEHAIAEGALQYVKESLDVKIEVLDCDKGAARTLR